MLLDKSPSNQQLDDLDKRAKNIRDKLQAQDTRPIVVEFAGSPKSGKSTNIDIIHHFFRRNDFKVWAPTEGASKRTPYSLKRDLVAFNTWSLSYAIQELLVAYNNVDQQHLIILDRGPFDSLAWMGVLQEQQEITGEDYEVYEKFALHRKWMNKIARVYLFTCSPNVSLERENEAKLTVQTGTAMNESMLSNLNEKYSKLEKPSLDTSKICHLDTSDSSSPRQSAFPIACDICSLFEQELGVS